MAVSHMANSQTTDNAPRFSSSSFSVGHCVVDARLRIISSNTLFREWVGAELGQLVTKALPILVGYEAVFGEILRGEAADLSLPYLRIFADREQYFDLHVGRFAGGEDALLLLLIDSTQTAVQVQ